MTVTINGTTGIAGVDGSASTPAAQGADTNTGIFYGTDIVGVSTGGSERMRIDSSGNVGIGTSSFATGSKLAVQTASGKLDVRSYGGSSVKLSSGAALGYNSTGSNGHIWEIDDVQKMAIDSSGNLLVGTTGTSPNDGVSNGGFSFQPHSGGSYYAMGHASGTGSGAWYTGFYYGSSAIGTITQNGTTGVNYSSASDYRLKENIQPMQNALGVVAQLNPVTYTWKSDGSDGQGFIAHELQAVVPDCVTGERDAVDAEGNPIYQGIDTSFLVATLTKAIQELSAKNDALEARITALEAK